MTASDMLRRTLALQDTLQRLVELLQADELDERYCDDLDAAVHAADTLLQGFPAAVGSTATAERQAAPTRRPVQAHGGQSAAAPATGKRGGGTPTEPASPPKGYQQCRRCELDKPFDAFPLSHRTPNGRDIWCRDCKADLERTNGSAEPETPTAEPSRPAPEQSGTQEPDATKVCSVGGCQNARAVKGYCHAHYYRVKKHGDPLADVPIGSKPPGKPLAGPKAPTEGSVPPGGPSGSKPDSAGSTPARPASNSNGDARLIDAANLTDAERERLRRRASDLRDTNPAEARRIVALLHGEGAPA